MRSLLATILVLGTVFLSSASAAHLRVCGTYRSNSGQVFNIIVSPRVSCIFALNNAQAVALRHHCAAGWRYSRRRHNSTGVCMRRGKVYFSLLG